MDWQVISVIHSCTTVLLKSKLTLETQTSRLDPRALMLETFEDRVSSLKSWGSRKPWSRSKAFSNMQKLERVSRKRFISRRKNNTALLTQSANVSRRSLSHENPYDSGLNVIFFLRQLVFKTKCRLAADDGNSSVIADNPLRSELFFAKFLK